MVSVFQRIFKIGQAEAHSFVDKLEDPIRMTEQGIRDLKKNLQEAMTSLAEVKATAIRLKKDADDQKKLAQDYERKAMLLLQKLQQGELQPPAEGQDEVRHAALAGLLLLSIMASLYAILNVLHGVRQLAVREPCE